MLIHNIGLSHFRHQPISTTTTTKKKKKKKHSTTAKETCISQCKQGR